MAQTTLFDHDAATGVLEHHLDTLSEIDQRVLKAVIHAYETEREVEDKILEEARYIFATYRADGRP